MSAESKRRKIIIALLSLAVILLIIYLFLQRQHIPQHQPALQPQHQPALQPQHQPALQPQHQPALQPQHPLLHILIIMLNIFVVKVISVMGYVFGSNK